jgi:hypothetical protein
LRLLAVYSKVGTSPFGSKGTLQNSWSELKSPIQRLANTRVSKDDTTKDPPTPRLSY